MNRIKDIYFYTRMPLMILPGICAYIQSIFIEKVFGKYMPKEET